MDNWSDIFAPLIGRILMGGFFLWNGIEATLNFPATTVTFVKAGVPFPISLALLAVAVEVLCGLALIVGFSTRAASLLLVVFIFAAALINPSINSGLTQTLFLQDMAIIGGLLYISAYGSGLWSTNWPYKNGKK